MRTTNRPLSPNKDVGPDPHRFGTPKEWAKYKVKEAVPYPQPKRRIKKTVK